MKIYIAGPMRNYKNFNFPAFDAARDRLEALGWEVISPADLDRAIGFDAMQLPEDTDWRDVSKLGFDLRAAVRRDVDAICNCDAIFMLNGWGQSKGANAEWYVAHWLGLEKFYATDSYPNPYEVQK